MLLSLTLSILGGCAPDAVDTGPIDATSAASETDDEARAERHEAWIAAIDPYVVEAADWTFQLDWEGFVADLPAGPVQDHYLAGGPATEDTEVIDGLVGALPVANAEAAEAYATYQAIVEAGGHAWATNNTYWWGRQSCFGGGDEDWMLSVMRGTSSAASVISRYTGAPGWIVSRYLRAMTSSAASCDASRGYFCISYSYSGFMWVSC